MKKKLLGFTLIEVVMALALGSLLLVAATSMLFSFSELWISQNEDNFLNEHVQGLSLFLNKNMNRSAFSVYGDTTVKLDYPPKMSKISDPYFAFKFKKAPALLIQDFEPKGVIDGYLAFKEKEGLILVWYSPKDDEKGEKILNKLILSHWVNSVSYFYYDEKKNAWEEEKKLKPSKKDLPDGFMLNFKYKDKKASTYISVKSKKKSSPFF